MGKNGEGILLSDYQALSTLPSIDLISPFGTKVKKSSTIPARIHSHLSKDTIHNSHRRQVIYQDFVADLWVISVTTR